MKNSSKLRFPVSFLYIPPMNNLILQYFTRKKSLNTDELYHTEALLYTLSVSLIYQWIPHNITVYKVTDSHMIT